MNTADRSIALLDTALRRRFGFIELMPDAEVLGGVSVDGMPLGPWLDALNAKIVAAMGPDGRNLQVGHAYLLESGRPVTTLPALSRIVRDDIVPLLQEYCYEDYRMLEQILGKAIVDAALQQVHVELFQEDNREALKLALLAISPDITASSQAVAAEAEMPAEVSPEELADADGGATQSEAESAT
jgi:5-methylcytosine-specific restriction protein B